MQANTRFTTVISNYS